MKRKKRNQKKGKSDNLLNESLDYETVKSLRYVVGVLVLGAVFRATSATRDETNPPKNVELLLSLLLRREERDAVLGDLIERYRRLHKRLGKRRADLYAYGEVFRSLYPLIKRFLFDTGLLMLVGRWIRG